MYVAALRPKEGELRALEKLSEFNLKDNSFLPMFIIGDFSSDILDSINRKYPHRALLDTRELDADDIETIEELLSKDPQYGSKYSIVYPIEKLLYSDEDTSDIDYVRIPKNSINGFFIQWLNSNSSLLPDNVIIDFEEVDDKMPESLLSSVISILNQIQDRNIIILSGAIPKSLPVKSTINYTLPRYEKNLFQDIKSKVEAELIYADYCTVCPNPIVTSGPIIPIVQIKYTLDANYWFVRNGQRRGNYDFVAVCSDIISSAPNFDPDYCWGNDYIDSVVSGGKNKGNPSVWVSIGVNQHIHLCVDENL